MDINEVGTTHAMSSLSAFLLREADLDTLAKLYSLYITDSPVQIFDDDTNGKSEVFEDGKEISDKTTKE